MTSAPHFDSCFSQISDATADRFRTPDDIFEEASLRLTGAEDSLPPSQTHIDSPVRKSSDDRGKGREDRPITASDIISFGALDCVQPALLRVCEMKSELSYLLGSVDSLQELSVKCP